MHNFEIPSAALAPYLCLAICFYLLWRTFVPPHRLRDLPRVPILPLIKSYAKSETEERRTIRLLLPCAQQHRSGLVLVWAFGIWIVHCVDPKAGKTVMENRAFDKQPPPEGMLFWRFIGRSNIIVIDNTRWKELARPIRNALARSAGTCMPQFVKLSRELVEMLNGSEPKDGSGKGSFRVCWSSLSHRFSLDAIGTTALGYNFHALACPESTFVSQYHRVMRDIAQPLYVFFPALERLLPRRSVAKNIDELVAKFLEILEMKGVEKGEDILSYMSEDSNMTPTEKRDNMITLFMAGHDTTAGSLSSLIYCLAKHPEYQRRAREEVLSKLGADGELNAEDLASLSFVQSCIREGMRYHNPSTTAMPRIAQVPVDVAGYTIPPNTPVMLNMYGVHHNPSVWTDPETFDPERFLQDHSGENNEGIETENGWLPFGLGPRSCPARAFSLLEQKTLLVMLLRSFEWRLPEDSIHKEHLQVAFSVFALNLPRDLDIIFSRI